MESKQSKGILLFLLLTLFKTSYSQTCKGCINLDEYNFNKIISKFKFTLVKYDIAYPYGSTHDAFVEFGNSIAEVKDLIIGEVGIKDYGQKDNEEFAKSQNVDPKKLPVIRLYNGIEDVATFNEKDVTVEKLRQFLLDNSNVHITLPGCLEELDLLAMQFVQSNQDKKKIILKQTEEFKTENINTQKMYLLFMKKLLEDKDFVEKENTRLKKILAEGKLAEGKKVDLQNKLNILYSFENKEAKKEEKQEL